MKIVITIILLTWFQFTEAQSFSIKKPENNTEKFQNLLMEIEDVSFENFKFISEEKNQKHNYKLLLSRYINGILSEENFLFESNPNLNWGNFENNELDFSIIGKAINKDEYKIIFNINTNIYLKQTLNLDEAEKFSIKHFFNQKMDFIKGKKTLLFALVKPIKIDKNTYRDCDFNLEKDKPEQWFTTFGTNDYVIIEIFFE